MAVRQDGPGGSHLLYTTQSSVLEAVPFHGLLAKLQGALHTSLSHRQVPPLAGAERSALPVAAPPGSELSVYVNAMHPAAPLPQPHRAQCPLSVS